MITIAHHHSTDPATNLATEEYLLKHAYPGEDILIFYVNAPSVIIGKHQNVFEEVDIRYAEENGIAVHRRLSGGGAVYHDTGNLNFAFICRRRDRFPRAAALITPIVSALNQIGIPAAANTKNDIFAADAKISGLARYSDTRSMLCHGTLLVCADLAALSRALHPRAPGISSGSVKSIRSPVANISDLTAQNTDVERIRRILLERIREYLGPIEPTELSSTARERIRSLAKEKYNCWDWNFGRAPRFAVQRVCRMKGRQIPVTMTVEKGRIRGIAASAVWQATVDERTGHLMGQKYLGSETERLLAAAIEGRE